MAYSTLGDPDRGRAAGTHGANVTLLPWEYLWLPFTRQLFPDLFDPVWISSLLLVVALIVLYNVRTRALHRHRLYTDMWEWLLWTGLITFLLAVMGAVFVFDFAVVLVILVTGLAVMVWVRFRRYPPLFAAYEQQLARQRYLSRQKAARPEATIRSRGSRRRRR
ncbi:MAG: hypothetical protein V4515_10815 [Chloroflexota bacterium]